MKNSILCLCFILTQFSYSQDYKKEWKKVEDLDSKELPKSALKEVENIYKKATKSKNSPQIIKSLFFKSKYALILEEDAQLKVIKQFKKQIANSKFPAKNLLENALANLYWQYCKNNWYTFYRRTETNEKVNKEDFRSWDLQTLYDEIHNYNVSSLKEISRLQKINIEKYKDVIKIDQLASKKSVTLYDFLAYNSIRFYSDNRTGVIKPKEEFSLDDEKFIGDFNNFSKLDISSIDSNALELHTLKLYQELIKFHLKNKNYEALVYADIERLKFVKSKLKLKGVDTLYLKALSNAVSALDEKEASALYLFTQAKYYEANSPNKSLKYCDEILSKFPNNKVVKLVKTLKKLIKNKSLSVVSEAYIPINMPSRLLIKYKNIDKLYLHIYEINSNKSDEISDCRCSDKKLFEKISKLNLVTKWSKEIRNEKDYKAHSTELIVPELKAGKYLILASPEANSPSAIYSYTEVQVTNLAVENIDKTKIQVLDRVSGKPVPNAKVRVYHAHKKKLYDEKFISDNNGFVTLNIKSRNNYVIAEVTTKNDRLITKEFSLRGSYDYSDEDRINSKPFIFTDRSIYRPGQTVYYKGILVATKPNSSELITKGTVKVSLLDVNYQKVKEVELALNEFGSFSGQFILPNNGQTGRYRIKVALGKGIKHRVYDNSTSFSVEEYKRPKFEVSFEPVKESYSVNDEVKIKGFAKSFSGANVTDAKVVYNIVRTGRYPYWCHWGRFLPYIDSKQIQKGEIKTDDKGNFTINFKALADESADKKFLPTFSYAVSVDVTDINGETHHAVKKVNVGYHSLNIQALVKYDIDKLDENNVIAISTLNLNHEFVSAKGTLEIYKLQSPKNVLRKRSWPIPDFNDIPEDTFRKLFPNDAYDKVEESVENWEKSKLVYTKKFDTSNSKEYKLNDISGWTSGKYVVIISSTDKNGKKIVEKKIFSVFSGRDKTIADKQLFYINQDKLYYKSGEKVKVKVGSAAKEFHLIMLVEKNRKFVETKVISLHDEVKTIELPFTKKDFDEGGFAVQYYYVNNNRFGTGSMRFDALREFPELKIETSTFRDKIQPGTEQEWSFVIKNDKKGGATAEVLASMYDASLDKLMPHSWSFYPITYKYYYSSFYSIYDVSFGNSYSDTFNMNYIQSPFLQDSDAVWNWFGFGFYNSARPGRLVKQKRGLSTPAPLEGMVSGLSVKDADGYNDKFLDNNIVIRGNASVNSEKPLYVIDGVPKENFDISSLSKDEIVSMTMLKGTEAATLYGSKGANGVVVIVTSKGKQQSEELSKVKARTNFNETAFFYPQLRTDKNGNVKFSFKTPDVLTRWKLNLLAHNKQLHHVIRTLETVTQKELMVVPNVPRFLRHKDKITISTKISNLSDKDLKGVAKLILTDAITGKTISIFDASSEVQSFEVSKKGNTNVSWDLEIPETVDAVQYKIVAKAGDFSDGEQNVLPVLSNRTLVTESLPLWVNPKVTKTFTLKKLVNSNSGGSLKNHKLTLDFTSNPSWYAVQALPYLMEYPYECAEQTFSRYYANTLASHIVNRKPKIKAVFDQWKSSKALLSNLEKNQELKSLIIQETPWLRDVVSESEQKRRIALLFDFNTMQNMQSKALAKLKEMQYPNGGYAWFKGAKDVNPFISLHIATGIGRLKHLGVATEGISKITSKLIPYLDSYITKRYQKLSKIHKVDLDDRHTNTFEVQYLYMRSFYSDIKMSKETQVAFDYYAKQSAKYWKNFGLYGKGLICLSNFRSDNKRVANEILNSLDENSITSEELGMYWKSNTSGWGWYQAPVETQSLMIEVFSEVGSDSRKTNNLKKWLLKHKQVNRWKTTKATADAVYALLLKGSDWLSVTESVVIKLGQKEVNPSKISSVKTEAGTGFFKTSWDGKDIKPAMGKVTITSKSNVNSWGGLYWQYFEDLDKITSSETPLKLKKKLFKKINTDSGKQLVSLDKTTLKVGDILTVRIELRSDRDIQFIHMKDMRASGVEPINVLSRYKWQDGLGYYESTKDASTNFFFDRIPKGVYVFEYDVRVNNVGDFSNGITTIESMYAPDFRSHSKGVRVKVVK